MKYRRSVLAVEVEEVRYSKNQLITTYLADWYSLTCERF
jgi:hypothetical protein